MVAIIWNSIKFATQNNHDLLPRQFFYSRVFLNAYNLIFLAIMWYKVRKARKEKLDLELQFFNRLENLILKTETLEIQS